MNLSRELLILYLAVLGLFGGTQKRGFSEPGEDDSGRPSTEVLRKHADRSVRTYGPYVAVKLPLDGVPLRNPSVVIEGNGTIYGANYTGKIYRLLDTDGDGLEDRAELFVDIRKHGHEKYPNDTASQYRNTPQGPGLRYPTGMTFHDGWLYVATTQEIARFRDEDGDGRADTYETFAAGWPYTLHYFDWTMGLRVGPDGWFYTNLSTDYLNPDRRNDPRGLRGAMVRISSDGETLQRFATGLRWAYDLDFNERGALFFSDNQGGGNPTEEINHAVKEENYGHNPHGKPEGVRPRKPVERIDFGAGSAGVEFNPADNDRFGPAAGDLFVSMWGNDGQWDHGTIVRVNLFKQDGAYHAVEHPFADGPAKISDLCFGSDGSLYVARFGIEGIRHTPYRDGPMGGYYRFFYAPDLTDAHPVQNPLTSDHQRRGNPENGKTLFQERACATCHTVSGKGGHVGPDLKDVGRRLDRKGLLESIRYPSRNIKTNFETYVLVRKSGKNYRGRLLSAGADRINFRAIGNRSLNLPRSKVTSLKEKERSLMPGGLLKGLSKQEVNDLLVYLESLDEGGPDHALRVNAGGEAVVVNGGKTYLRDRTFEKGGYGFDGGRTVTSNRENHLARTGRAGENVTFRADVRNGRYVVTVAVGDSEGEGASQNRLGLRAVSGRMGDRIPASDPDRNGMRHTSFTVEVSNESLEVEFVREAGKPIIHAIQILPEALAEDREE